LVDLDVFDDQVAGIETLGIGVGLGVTEKSKEELGGLYGPAGTGDTERLSYNPKISALVQYPISFMVKSKSSSKTYPVRFFRCFHSISSWERPPCGRQHSRGIEEHEELSSR
jgi:hypothetical protein